MTEWAVAASLIVISVIVAVIVFSVCRFMGGWTWIYAWMTSSHEEHAQLASCEQYNANGYMINCESDPDIANVHINQITNYINDTKRMDHTRVQLPIARQSFSKPPAPPPPLDSAGRRFSLDLNRRRSIDSELPDALCFDGSGSKIQRALSCDSVCSDTSVVMETLDSPEQNGEVEIELQYTTQREELIVTVLRARRLMSQDLNSQIDSYVRVSLSPDQNTNMQTAVQKGTSEPVFGEKFLFGVSMKDLPKSKVSVYAYSCEKYTNTLIGEGEIRLAEIDLRNKYVTWVSVLDTNQKNKGLGDIMFSLSYLPTAERLTVVIVKARNLVWTNDKENADPYVKVYLLQKGKKISKKKTSIKKSDRNPTFNEAMIFSVPAMALQSIQVRLSVTEYNADGKMPTVGHVFVGPNCLGKSLSHWNQMMTTPRKPIAMWHTLRK